MGNNNYIFKKISNNPYFLFIIIFITIGTFIVTSMYSGYPYITKLIGTFSFENYTTIFIFPSFLFVLSIMYKELSNEYILLKFKTRYEYLKLLIKNAFKLTTLLFVITLIILIICANLTSGNQFIIEKYEYTYNIIWLFIYIIKLFLAILVFQTFCFSILIKIKNKNVANFINILLIIYIYFSKYLIGWNIYFNYLFPPMHLGNTQGIEQTLSASIMSSTIYYGVLLIIGMILLKKTIDKKEFFNEID